MRKTISLVRLCGIAVILFCFSGAHAQQKDRQKADDGTVRLGVTLVQIDAVVTDKEGNQVEGLTADNFEVWDSGKKQRLQHCDYVRLGKSGDGSRPSSALAPQEGKAFKDAVRNANSKDLGRVFAFLVDDIRIASPELPRVREALSDFVENEMQEGDLAAIMQTSRSSGILHQFTTDKTILRRAIDQIRVSRVKFFGEEDDDEKDADRRAPSAGKANEFASSDSDLTPETVSGFNAASGLESLNYLIESMRQLPGRKAVVMISPGFGAFGVAGGSGGQTVGTSSGMLEIVMRRLTEAATRAGVVIHTVDVFGLREAPSNLFPKGIAATDDHAFGGFFGIFPGSATLEPGAEWGRQSVLRRLAEETGGAAIVNTNDLKGGMQRISRDLGGYYLLSYSRDDIKRDGRYHRIEVKLKSRSGLRVRTRDGYYSEAKSAELGFATSVSTEPPPDPHTIDRLFYQMMSPIAARELRLQPSLHYGQNQSGTVDIQAMLFISGEDVSFRKDGNGYASSVDVAGFFFNEQGKVVSHFARKLQSGWSAQSYTDMIERGLVISFRTSLPPGFYQFRAVVRDNFKNALGSASQSMLIPDPAHSELQLAPIIVSSKQVRALKNPQKAAREAELLQTRRIFPPHGTIDFLAEVFGAMAVKKIGSASIEQQVIVYQEGKKVFEGSKAAVQVLQRPHLPVAYAGGSIHLANFAPGRYLLVLKVTDTHGKRGRNTASQYLSFTVLE